MHNIVIYFLRKELQIPLFLKKELQIIHIRETRLAYFKIDQEVVINIPLSKYKCCSSLKE
jgi:hypothetical protein